MESVASLAVGYATGKLTEIVENAFRFHVVERRARYRAKEFFAVFCEAVTSEGTSDDEIQL